MKHLRGKIKYYRERELPDLEVITGCCISLLAGIPLGYLIGTLWRVISA